MYFSEKPSIKLLHYGLQRSGTNFLTSILKRNYRIAFLNENTDRSSPLQKHCRLYDNKDIIPEPQYRNEIRVDNFLEFESLLSSPPDYYIVISKDPYSWCLSYRNWAKRCNWPKVNHHYIEEYNLFYGKFLDLSSQSDKFIFVRYIDLIRNTDTVLRELEATMKPKKRLLARLSLGRPRKVSQSSRFTDEMRSYYTNEKYLMEYSKEDLQELNSFLNPHVVSMLGYEMKIWGRHATCKD